MTSQIEEAPHRGPRIYEIVYRIPVAIVKSGSKRDLTQTQITAFAASALLDLQPDLDRHMEAPDYDTISAYRADIFKGDETTTLTLSFEAIPLNKSEEWVEPQTNCCN